jgi:hypothetical protein
MELYITTEGYVNLGQEGRSYVLTVSRIEEFVDSLKEKYLVEDEWEAPFHKIDKDMKLLCLPINDNCNVNDLMFDEYIAYLSDLLEISEDVILELDYLNLRDF